MECEAEEPTGHLPTSPRSVLEPGNLDEGMCNYNVFAAGWFVVLPLGGLPACKVTAGVECSMNWGQNVGQRKTVEIHPEWESPNVSLANAFETSRRRISGCEVRKRVEATEDGHICQPLHPLSHHRFVVDDLDATDEDIEAVDEEGGVSIGQRRPCQVVQG